MDIFVIITLQLFDFFRNSYSYC